MMENLIFNPVVPLSVLAVLLCLGVIGVGVAWVRGLSGWWLRLGAFLLIILALAQPSIQEIQSDPKDDVVLIVVDKTTSNQLRDRAEQTEQAVAQLRQRLAERQNIRVQIVDVFDAPENAGSKIISAINQARVQIPAEVLSSIIVVSDGQVHDAVQRLDLKVPVHHIITGARQEFDRQIVITQAPAYTILGQKAEITLRVEDSGEFPDRQETVALAVRIGTEKPLNFFVPLDQDVTLTIDLPTAGHNILELTVPDVADEITTQNNRAIASVNVIRDRLRVLLVSGMPHPGARVWRNLLKSDSSVDLVHFTILRPPEKQDGVPVSELSLIAFPTRELFLEKIQDFDLIIFDRYKRRGILPLAYLQNVVDYVKQGGAVLVAAGPDFASANSIARSPLREILPGDAAALLLDEPFTPHVTDLGKRHPVTQNLPNPDTWGPWFRQVDINVQKGDVVMQGAQDQPLLILDRIEQGRVAVLASDQVWLWYRQYEQGGPHQELLRRVSHWLMKQPELQEESLSADQSGDTVTLTRRSLRSVVDTVTLTSPKGDQQIVDLDEAAPGIFQTDISLQEDGIYQMSDGELTAVFAKGVSPAIEFNRPLATPDMLGALVAQNLGGAFWIQDSLPAIRDVKPEKVSSGQNWMGIVRNGAVTVTDMRQVPLLPAWVMALLIIGSVVGMWLREGRR